MIVTSKDKKKRVSKKRKSSWRKHVDIQDVDDFLEDQRLEERLGKPFEVLKDEELFTLETDGEGKHLTEKQKKRLRLAAPPKCFAMLQPHTKVPDPITKRNRVRTRDERMCPILKKKENERKLKGILKPKEIQQIKDRQRYEETLKRKNDENIQDIWNITDNFDNNPWIETITKRHTLYGVGKLNKVIPRLENSKNDAIPIIEIPHPGTSYNPSLKDHTDLLLAITEKETKIIKEEEHLKRVTKDMFRKLTTAENNNAWISEMSQGLTEVHPSKKADVEAENDKPYNSINPPVVNKKKSLKQRRKQKEQLRLKEKRLQTKLEKKKTVDIHKIRLIKEQIENSDKKLEKQRELRKKIKMLKLKEPKQLSKLKYEEPDVEFNMIQDLTGSLRNLHKEGSLLTDRFRSLQKRNIIEVSTRQHRKKAKVKKYVKPGFKDGWKETVAKKNLLKLK